MWSPNELLKIEKQRDILSYITLQFFHFKKVPLEHCPLIGAVFFYDIGSYWTSIDLEAVLVEESKLPKKLD